MTHIYLLLGCLIPFQISRVYAATFESEINSLGGFSETHSNSHIDSKLKFLVFSSVPSKFVEIDSLNQLVTSGMSRVWDFISNQGYRPSWSRLGVSADSSGLTWDDMMRRLLGHSVQGDSRLDFIEHNPILTAQTMLLVELVKFCGIVFLCVGDSMVPHQL